MPQDLLVVAKFGAPFGVRGAIHIRSFTQPAQNFADYLTDPSPFFWRSPQRGSSWQALALTELNSHKGQFVAKVQGFAQREDLNPLKGAEIALSAARLPRLADDEYYWREMIGRRVKNTAGVDFGVVVDLLETGVHDVLIIETDSACEPAAGDATTVRRLIPFVAEFVVAVTDELVEVAWPEDWES